MTDTLERSLEQQCDLDDYVIKEEEMAIATAERTLALGVTGLVFLGTLHGTCVKGCPDAVLVSDSGWTLGTDACGYWLEHDESGEIRTP